MAEEIISQRKEERYYGFTNLNRKLMAFGKLLSVSHNQRTQLSNSPVEKNLHEDEESQWNVNRQMKITEGHLAFCINSLPGLPEATVDLMQWPKNNHSW